VVESSRQTLVLDEVWLILIASGQVGNVVIVALLALSIPMIIIALGFEVADISSQR
jgi:hypothetical protein